MVWDAEKVGQIPEVYRDFLLVLRTNPKWRNIGTPGSGTSLGRLFNALAPKYGYAREHIHAVAEELKMTSPPLIEGDESGFVSPTRDGLALIDAIAAIPEPEEEEEAVVVPEFPKF